MPPAFREANIRKFETEKAPRYKLSPIERTRHHLGLRFAEQRSVARAEASTTLTAITVGTDQSTRLARRLQTKPTHLPGQTARQLSDQSTILWVESSSTSVSRLRGARPTPDMLRREPSALVPVPEIRLKVRINNIEHAIVVIVD